MPVSDAKLAANRRNAQLSRGPVTPEGKAICRRNALKHGLTGTGVALPDEDQVEITDLHVGLQMDLKPQTDAGSQLLRRYAFLSVRLKRSERHETKMTARRVRHAVVLFDDERLHNVEILASQLYSEPMTTTRRLQMTPEGIDWLLEEWATLRYDLTHADSKNRFNSNHRMHFDCLLGKNPGGYRIARIKALADAMDGFYLHLEPEDGAGLDNADRSAWAKSELVRILDAEVERLEDLRAGWDAEMLEMDRAEAADRALLDFSPESILARKYEAATERAMFRTMKEYRQVEADAAAGRESAITPHTVRQSEPAVGPNLPEEVNEEPEAEEPAPESVSEPETVKTSPSAPTFLNISIGRHPEPAPKPAEQIDYA